MKQFYRSIALLGLIAGITVTADAAYYSQTNAFVNDPRMSDNGVFIDTRPIVIESNRHYASSYSKTNNTLVSTTPHNYYYYAKPADNWEFVRWVDADGNEVGTKADFNKSFKPSSTDKNNPTVYNYTAVFQPVYAKVAKQGEGEVSISSYSNFTGDQVTVSATPAAYTADTYHSFNGWYVGDTKVSDDKTYTFTVGDPVTVTAHFAMNKATVNAAGPGTAYILSEAVDADGYITVTTSQNALKTNEALGLTETRNNKVRFEGWYVGDEKISGDITCKVKLDSSKTITARYSIDSMEFPGNGYYRIRNAFNAPLAFTGSFKAGIPSIGFVSNSTTNFDGCLDWRQNPEGFGYGAGDNNIYCDPSTIIFVDGKKTSNFGEWSSDAGLLDDVELSAQGINMSTLTASPLGAKYKMKIKWASDAGYQKMRFYNDNGSEVTFALNGETPIVQMTKVVDDTPAERRLVFEPIDENHLDKYWFAACPDGSVYDYDGYWTTMYTAFPYQCMDGVKAYIVKQITNYDRYDVEFADMVQIEGNRVPANTPVILWCPEKFDYDSYLAGEKPAPANRLLPLAESVDASVAAGNLLKGAFQANTDRPSESDPTPGHVALNERMMMLGFDDNNNLAMVKPAATYAEGTAALPANCVYLELDNPSQNSYELVSADLINGVKGTADSPRESKMIYDIYGRRVSKMQHGNIYITEGRKVIY